MIEAAGIALALAGRIICAAGWRRSSKHGRRLAAANARLGSELASARVKLSAGGRACARQRRQEEARRRAATTAQLRREIAQTRMVTF